MGPARRATMLRSVRLWALAAVPFLLAPAACTTTTESDSDSSADEINYRSTAGQEFSFTTEVTFTPPADVAALQGAAKDEALTAHADKLRETVAGAISASLDKLWPEDYRTTSAGVAVQFRQGTATSRDMKAIDGGKYSLVVSADFAGVNDLLRKLPMKTDNGKTYLPVTADIGNGEEELRVTITPIERSLNAYPKYLELFEGGLDIAVHVGGD